jgi:hypothetical protein
MGTLLAGGGGAATVALTMLPAIGEKGEVFFVETLKGIPSTVASWLSPVVATVAGWFGWSKEPVGAIPLEPSGTPGFRPVPPPQPPPTMTAKIIAARVPDHLLTPALKQTTGSYECAPTAASMVLDYWHKRDSKHQTRTPQALIQVLDGRFNPKSGINADELVTGLKEMDLGYKTIERQASLDQQALQTELENGPVIAQVHLNWGSSG